MLAWGGGSKIVWGMMDEDLQLSCEKCGKLIDYDGVSSLGAKTICESCGSKNPHTLRGNPLLLFLLILVGGLAFALINPFDWSEDTMTLAGCGLFIMLFWCKVFLPYHIAQLKGQMRWSALGWSGVCFSFILFGIGSLSLLMFSIEMIWSDRNGSFTVAEPELYHYERIEGHAITEGIDSVPKSQPRGEAVVIRFSNELSINIRLYRFDNEGTMHSGRELVPRQWNDRDTFEGETWVVTDLDDTPLFYYVARTKASFAPIPPDWTPN